MRLDLELTELSSPTPREKDIAWTSNQICEKLYSMTLYELDILYTGVLLSEFISSPSLKEIIAKFDSLLDLAKKQGFAKLIIKNKVLLAFATKLNSDVLKQWAIDNHIIEEETYVEGVTVFKGPRFSIDETYRIKDRIEKKKRQLNKEVLNVIIIRNDRLFHSHSVIDNYINDLEEFVYRHNYLALLVIIGGYVRQKRTTSAVVEDIIDRNNHLYLSIGIDQFVREVLIVTNKYSINNKETLLLSENIKKSFRECKSVLI
jgi:hypothetical protein